MSLFRIGLELKLLNYLPSGWKPSELDLLKLANREFYCNYNLTRSLEGLREDAMDFIAKWNTGKFKAQVEAREDRKKFYSSIGWNHVKDVAFSVYGRICMLCGSTENLEVDHIISRKECKEIGHPELELALINTGILCHTCNNKKGNTSYDYRSAEDIKKMEEYLKDNPSEN